MRKILSGLLLLLFAALRAQGQSTTVSGQVTDAGSQAWNNGTYSFLFHPNPQYPSPSQYVWTGGALTTTISGALSGSGGYSVSIPSNTAISPIGSSWDLTVCPLATSGCFTQTAITITGSTLTVNETPPAIAINLGNPPGPTTRAYSDAEIVGAQIGAQYYNVTTQTPRLCLAVSGNLCTSWTPIGTGGSSLVPGGVTDSVQYNAGGGTLGGTSVPTLNGQYPVFYNVTANAAVVPSVALAGVPVNAQTGTSYPMVYSDRVSLLTLLNASPVAVSVPAANSTGFTSNFVNANLNLGAGLATYTPTTSQINGAATQILPTNWFGMLYSDNTNYFMPVLPSLAAFPNCTDTGGNHLNINTATGAIVCGTSGGTTGITGTLTSGTIPVATGAHTVGNSSVTDDLVNTVKSPDGISVQTNSYDRAIANNPITGTIAHRAVCYDNSATPLAIVCPTSTVGGVAGVADEGAGTTGSVQVGMLGQLIAEFDGNATAKNWAINSPTTVGRFHDTGSTTEPTGQQAFYIYTSQTGGAGGTALIGILNPDVISGGSTGTGGRGTNVQVNATAAKNTINFNATTPAAGANNQNLTFQSSASGNTTSASVEVPIASAAQGGIINGSCAAGKVLVGGSPDACIDFPDVKFIPAANCNNATAGNGWSIGSGGTVTCRAGTNNLGGYVSITDTSSTFATFQVPIPEDWDSSSNPYIRFQLASTDATNGHTIIPSIQVACYKGDGSTTDDVVANAAHSLSTTTLNGNANRFWSGSNVQMNSTDVTGCVAGALMQVTVGRATDTATNAEFYGATITFPRLLTGQAN